MAARAAINWLEVMQPQPVGEPGEPAPVALLCLSSPGELLDVAGEMIRLGCDRQRYQLGEQVLLMVDSPPYYTLLRALDPDATMAAYRPTGRPRVWIELGYEHPLADRISAPDDVVVLVTADGWRVLPDGPWEEVDRLLDVALPGTTEVFSPALSSDAWR